MLFRHPLLAVLICALLWGSAFPAIKTVYQHWQHIGINRTLPLIFLFAGIRFSIAGGALLLIGKNLKAEIKATPAPLIIAFALTQTFIQYIFFYQAIAVSSATLSALLVVTGSYWWILLAPLLQKTPWPNRNQWLALLLGSIGVTLAIYRPGAGSGNPITGTFYMLIASGSGAVALTFFSKIKPTMSAINATGLSLFTGGLGLSLIGIPALSILPQMFPTPVIIATLWLAFVSAAAFTIWNHLSTIFPVNLLATYRFLIPLCGVFEALLFLRTETPGLGLALGGPLVIISMILARRTTTGRMSH